MRNSIDKIITGLTVTWKYAEIIERAYTSVRKFHPEMELLVVDGSSKDMPCYQYLNNIQDNHIEIHHVNHNIGHGKGISYGIEQCKTPFVLLFDSDIIMVESPVQGMLNMMEDDTAIVGYMEWVAEDGHDHGVFPKHKNQPKIKYPHPYFQLIQLKEFKKYKQPIHHGAPMISTALDIHKKGLSDKVLKEFPDLGHTSGCGISWKPCEGKYIKHDVGEFGGTGRQRIKEGLPHIEGKWDTSYV